MALQLSLWFGSIRRSTNKIVVGVAADTQVESAVQVI